MSIPQGLLQCHQSETQRLDRAVTLDFVKTRLPASLGNVNIVI